MSAEAGEYSLLLVQGDPMMVGALADLLTDADSGSRFRVSHAGSLAEATGKLRTERFDAALLDASLPDGSGVECVRAVLAQAPDLPIVILAAPGAETLVAACIDAGAHDFVRKPPEPTALARIVTMAINRARGMQVLRLSEKMEAIGAFAEGVAHDFNNILLVMLVYGDMIRAACPPTDPRLPDLTELLRAIEQGQALTGQLLEFSRKAAAEPRIATLGRMTAELSSILRRTLPANIEIVTTVAQGLWPVRGDQRQIEDLIANLAATAKDAMADGGTFTVEIGNRTVRNLDGATPAGDYVIIKVSDSGAAIDPALLPRIFEPYFAANKLGRGTALGLAKCYATVACAGGTITAASETGRGTAFTITLPRASDVAIAEPSAVTVERARSRDNNEVILVAENILRNGGYEVLTAPNGEEARKVLQRDGERIHLVLTDMSMPQLGGPELDRYVKTHWPKLPLVFMSGSSGYVLSENEAFRIDERRAVMKPFRARELLRVVQEALKERGETNEGRS
jgi:two-component system cell cycle sensor histidine kinase/response regulator CckA